MKKILFILSLVVVVVFITTATANAEATPGQIAHAQQQISMARCNMQFPTQVKNHFLAECGFTEEEAEVFNMRARGYSIVRISIETGYSESAIQARIRNIKRKIKSLQR